jgi:BirA family biotin operon repressor/biotin-[acetyl-CoA-carboxylase] ligase
VETVFRHGAVVGSSIEQFARLSRGMDLARQRITACEAEGRSFASGLVILAGELDGGCGRFRRAWHAPAGGLWMTLVLANTLLPESTRLYPLAAGIACCEAVCHLLPAARLKWVNDVHLDNKKIAGILIETMFGPRYGEEYILVGIGVNVNNSGFPAALDGRAAALRDLLGQEIDLERFAARLLAKLSWNIGLLHYEEERRLRLGADNAPGDHPLVSRFRQLSDTVGRRVSFGFNVQEKPQFEARVLGIDPSGGLLLQLAGSPEPLLEHAGEIVYLD